MTEMAIPVLPKCRVCNHENKFSIQKALDEGGHKATIAKKYDISVEAISSHIFFNHRPTLIAYGTMDYVIRKKAIDVGLTLADFIEKWSEGTKGRISETIKDGDAIKAMELYLKSEGSLVNKHEVTVKRSIEDALKDYLTVDEEKDEAEHSETKKIEDGTTKTSEATGI